LVVADMLHTYSLQMEVNSQTDTPTQTEVNSAQSGQYDVDQVAAYLKTRVHWQSFVNLVKSIGNQFNDAQWRFLKAIIFETSIEKFSGGAVKYVARKGCDFIIPAMNNVTVEMKYVEDALYTAKGRVLRPKTKSLTLMNSKGTNVHKALPSDYADYLLVVGQLGGALVDKATLSEYIEINGDSISATIPTEKMKLLFTPDSVNLSTPPDSLDLISVILSAINQALDKFM
jgi:hypothetical protein